MAANVPLTPGRLWGMTFASAFVLLVVLVAMPLWGATAVDLRRAWAGQSPDAEILLAARLPRALLAAVSGGALALAGVLFQALLRDALATPYTLGVSSGASLGAVVAICAGWRPVGSMPAIWIAAFLGAAVSLVLVLGIAAEGRRLSQFTLLLAGITLNSICFAIILFLQNVSTFGQSFAIVHWLMGSVEVVEYSTIGWLSLLVLPVCIYVCYRARDWNLLAVGEEWAAARGLQTGRALLAGYLAGSFLTGAITALTGPISFLGLIVPHALRLRFGADHRCLLPVSFFLGGAFLVVCDALSRTILAPTEVPVGVVTALVGGPYFIFILRGQGKSKWR